MKCHLLIWSNWQFNFHLMFLFHWSRCTMYLLCFLQHLWSAFTWAMSPFFRESKIFWMILNVTLHTYILFNIFISLWSKTFWPVCMCPDSVHWTTMRSNREKKNTLRRNKRFFCCHHDSSENGFHPIKSYHNSDWNMF